MNFSSETDCLLITARALAAAHYCIKSGKYNAASTQIAKQVAKICEPIISNHGMAITTNDGPESVSTQVIWPTGERSQLPDNEPFYWAEYFAPQNWDQSDLKRDLEKALQLFR
jgi:hypothetical protein